MSVCVSGVSHVCAGMHDFVQICACERFFAVIHARALCVCSDLMFVPRHSEASHLSDLMLVSCRRAFKDKPGKTALLERLASRGRKVRWVCLAEMAQMGRWACSERLASSSS